MSQVESPSQSINQSMLYLSIITVLHIYNNLKSKRKYCNNGWVNTETLLLLSYDMTSVHPHSYYSHKLGSIIPCIHTTFIQYPTGLTNKHSIHMNILSFCNCKFICTYLCLLNKHIVSYRIVSDMTCSRPGNDFEQCLHQLQLDHGNYTFGHFFM